MNSKFLVHTFFLSIVTLFIVQCKTDDDSNNNSDRTNSNLPPATDTLLMSEELKSYYYFGEGSWWVYKRTDTNATVYDTATLVRQYQEIVYNQLSFPVAWEVFSTSVEHSYYPSSPGAISPNLTVSTQNFSRLTDRIDMTSSKTYLSSLFQFFSVPIDSDSMLLKSKGLTQLISTDTLKIDQQTFFNTVHIHHGPSNFRYEIWMTPNVGITKCFNVEDSTTWELINYDIKF